MNPKRIFSRCGALAWYLSAAAGFALLIVAISLLVKPDANGKVPDYGRDEMEHVSGLRKMEYSSESAVLTRKADYSQGDKAAWFPKNESPLLSDLVMEGKLPPVAERVGPEPCVMEGVDGIGVYGGTWNRIANSDADVGIIGNRISYSTLLRWSPKGYPLVPHVAKDYKVLDNSRIFIIELRKGMKWSDGHPFTANDILYWWKNECNDRSFSSKPPPFMTIRGKVGNIEKIDDFSVKFSFPETNGLFLSKLAGWESSGMLNCPEHYLKQFHPTVGDKNLIQTEMKKSKLPDAIAVYWNKKFWTNPEHPRLWPWVYRSFRINPPQSFVRNPYYWVVDTAGNQLPYIDRLQFEVKDSKNIPVDASEGLISMQARHIRYSDYTLLMSQRNKSGYEIYHWYPGDRSLYVICPNLNRRMEDDKPETKYKKELLGDKRFRQALSLAIRRKAIIDADYNGQAEPVQLSPGPESKFYVPELCSSFTKYDPKRANEILDELGLGQRDREGFRKFPDGGRMTFYLDYCNFTGSGPSQFVVDDWAEVGIRAIHRERARQLWYTESMALLPDFNVWMGNSETYPLNNPNFFVPVDKDCVYAVGYGKWFNRGGLYGNPEASRKYGCIEPPSGHPIRESMILYDKIRGEPDQDRQIEIFKDILRIAAENIWTINVCSSPPALCVVKNGFKNVPKELVFCWAYQSPGNAGPETFFFEKPHVSQDAGRQMKKNILEASVEFPVSKNGKLMSGLVKITLLLIVVIMLVLVALKHPHFLKRLLLMLPTLLVVSVLVFIIIQLPPSDFLTSKIMELQESGDEMNMNQIEQLREMFQLDKPVYVRYLHWTGLKWFITFNVNDEGLLQGNLGRSMEGGRPVNDIVGDRIMLTVLISFCTIIFSWLLSIPIGIFSAARQYSVMDYILTFLGFIGMCVPAFLLALLLRYVSYEFLGEPFSGLFSPEYGAQSYWDWNKVVDLMKHIWVPILVLGVGSTAGGIRFMRANLLDELRKPYVVTARAKGVHPFKLLLKYPVRIALNPFISGIGDVFPALVSGGAIVAMVLSLPTVGPLMLSAIMVEDMYLAGSMLMVLSLLTVLGTLVSDLLLLYLDPRIRFEERRK